MLTFLSYRDAFACKVSNFLKRRLFETVIILYSDAKYCLMFVDTQGGDAEDSAIDDIFSDTDDWDEDIKEDKKPTP